MMDQIPFLLEMKWLLQSQLSHPQTEIVPTDLKIA